MPLLFSSSAPIQVRQVRLFHILGDDTPVAAWDALNVRTQVAGDRVELVFVGGPDHAQDSLFTVDTSFAGARELASTFAMTAKPGTHFISDRQITYRLSHRLLSFDEARFHIFWPVALDSEIRVVMHMCSIDGSGALVFTIAAPEAQALVAALRDLVADVQRLARELRSAIDLPDRDG